MIWHFASYWKSNFFLLLNIIQSFDFPLQSILRESVLKPVITKIFNQINSDSLRLPVFSSFLYVTGFIIDLIPSRPSS